MSASDEDRSINGGVGVASGDRTPLAGNGGGSSGGGTGQMVLLTLTAGIGGFLFGYDTGVISGAMLYIRRRFGLSSLWQELIVSVTIGSAAIFALVASGLNSWLGRRPCILLASLVFAAGSAILAFAQSSAALLAGRLTVGAGIGVASMTVPMYIAESAPAHLRGRLVAMNTVFITLGQFVAAVVDGAFAGVHDGWRWMLGLAALPACLQLACFVFLPESPRWLVAKNQSGAARLVLQRLRGGPGPAVDAEMEEIQAKHNEEARARLEREQSGKSPRPMLLQMLETPWTRRALLIGCGLQAFQQLAGINTVMYYSASIIKMAGVRDDSVAVWLSSATAAVNFLACLVGLCLVERIGRRSLLIGSLCGVTVCLALLAVGFQVIRDNSAPVTFSMSGAVPPDCLSSPTCDSCTSVGTCGFCYTDGNSSGACVGNKGPCPTGWLLADDYCPTPYGWLVLLGLLAYLASFAPGMAPVPWIVNAEIYPLWGRSVGTGLATSVNWLCNLAVSLTFLTLTESLTKHGTYWLYSGLSLAGLLFVAKFVPETRGRSLEQIEAMLESGDL